MDDSDARMSREEAGSQDAAASQGGEVSVNNNLGNDSLDNAAPSSDVRGSEAPASDVKMQDLLREVELEATLRFGSREMTLGEVLDLGPGDVIELDRQIHDSVDLLVGDKIVARGVAVLTEGRYGLRITEVAEAKKSLESIRCLF